MLEYLGIENLAVISSAEIEFSAGLNIITGETGAGKSMVVQALSLLRGERANSGWIRSGEESAKISSVFDLEEFPLPDSLMEPDQEPDPTINLERVIRDKGKGRIKINGSLCKASQLKELTGSYIELSSQHDQQVLLSPSRYLTIIDDAADLAPLLKEYAVALQTLDTAADELARLRASGDAREQRLADLTFTFKELEALAPVAGEMDELLHRRRRLKASHQLISVATSAEESLYSDDDAVLERLHNIIRDLTPLTDVEPRFAESVEQLGEATTLLEEVSAAMRTFSNMENELYHLEEVEARLHKLERALSKYGVGEEQELIELFTQTKKELGRFENLEHTITEAAKAVEHAQAQAATLAARLHERRVEAGSALARAITSELADLGFPDARFLVDVTTLSPRGDAPSHRLVDDTQLTRTGYSQVAFTFTANPGETPRPVAQSASGGELSRIHLAMKVALAKGDNVVTTVYDEVDSGIGGPVATAVGQKLRQVARRRQVICITHLPQIAAFATTHFVVYKEVINDRTYTRIKKLNEPERLNELARMMGGVTPEALEHARALIKGTPS